MSDIEYGSIDVEIKSSASVAVQGLQKLASQLERVNSSLSKINTSGIKSFSRSVREMSSAMQELSSKNVSFTKVTNGIKKFEKIDTSAIAKVATSVRPLAESINKLNGISFDSGSLTSFVNSVSKLSTANLGALNTDSLTRVGEGIKAMSQSLQGSSEVSSNIIALTNAVGRLSQGSQYISQTIAYLPNLAEALRSFIVRMRDVGNVNTDVTNFTLALGQLASAGNRTATTASNLKQLGVALREFFETMSNAPNVSQNVLQMTQALAQLSQQSGSATRGLRAMSTSSGLGSMPATFDKTAKSAKSLAFYFGKLYANFFLIMRGFNALKSAMNLSSSLTEVQNVVEHTFYQATGAVNEFASTAIEKFGMSELSAKQFASRFQAMGMAMGITNSQVSKAHSFLDDLVTDTYKGGAALSDMSLNLTKLTADFASFYDVNQSDVMQDLTAILTGMTKPMRDYGLDLTQATLKEWAMKNGLDADIQSMSQAQKTLLRYQYVMANATNVMDDYARTSDSWANRTRRLKQQFEQLGIVIGQTFVNALKPALRALNNFMQALINFAIVVGNALGKIFGWTYETGSGGVAQDLEYASGYADDLEDGLGGALDTAKKLKAQLQGFDELNNLTTSSDSGSGKGSGSDVGSGGAGNLSSLGEWKETETFYESFINDLEGLGEWISKTLTSQLRSIDWDKVYEGARNFGKGLADFLNGLINPDLFYEVGKTIANSLNTAILSASTFAKTLDWKELGVSIGESINGFFKNFDAKEFAEGINAFVQGIWETLTNAISTISWSDISEKIGEFIGNLDLSTIVIILGGITLKKGSQFAVSLASGVASEITKQITSKITGALIGSNVAGGTITASGGSLLGAGTLILTIPLGIKILFDILEVSGINESITDAIFGKGTREKSNKAAEEFGKQAEEANQKIMDKYGKIAIFNGQFWSDLFNGNLYSDDLVSASKASSKLKGVGDNLYAGVTKSVGDAFSKGQKGLTKNVTSNVQSSINKVPMSTNYKNSAGQIVNGLTGEIVKSPNTGDGGVALGKATTKGINTELGISGSSSSIMANIGRTITNSLKSGIDNNKTYPTNSMKDTSSSLLGAWSNSEATYKNIGTKSMTSLSGGVTSQKGLVTTQMKSVVDRLKGQWSGSETTYRNAGTTAMTGLDSGIKTKFSKTKSWYSSNSRLNAPTIVGAPDILGTIRKSWNTFIHWWSSLKISFPSIKLPHFKVSGGKSPFGFGGKGYMPSISIDWYANGGFPDADLFFANENGVPELVGTMGGKTAVASGHEITGISDAVYSTGQTNAQLLQKAISLLDTIADKEFGITGDELYKSVRKADKAYATRTGQSAFQY